MGPSLPAVCVWRGAVVGCAVQRASSACDVRRKYIYMRKLKPTYAFVDLLTYYGDLNNTKMLQDTKLGSVLLQR